MHVTPWCILSFLLWTYSTVRIFSKYVLFSCSYTITFMYCLVQCYKELSFTRTGVVCLSSPHLYSTVTHRHIQLLLFQASTYTVAEATMSIRVYLDNHTLHHKDLSQFLWAEWLLHSILCPDTKEYLASQYHIDSKTQEQSANTQTSNNVSILNILNLINIYIFFKRTTLMYCKTKLFFSLQCSSISRSLPTCSLVFMHCSFICFR